MLLGVTAVSICREYVQDLQDPRRGHFGAPALYVQESKKARKQESKQASKQERKKYTRGDIHMWRQTHAAEGVVTSGTRSRHTRPRGLAWPSLTATVIQMQSSSRSANLTSSSTSHSLGNLWKRRLTQQAAERRGHMQEHPHTSSTSLDECGCRRLCTGRLSWSHCTQTVIYR
jgi:hypothetical protein